MLGEMGPGDNIGLVASKTSATGIRGEYYAIAAAMGKIGACKFPKTTSGKVSDSWVQLLGITSSP